MSKTKKGKAEKKATQPITEAESRVTTPAASRRGAKKPKAEKTAKREPKSKRISAIEAAAQVLARSAQPMRAQDLITAMAERGLWQSPRGKTPHATLCAAMLREIAEKGKEARFQKVERGMFATRVKKGV
jgi:hypothetical protein